MLLRFILTKLHSGTLLVATETPLEMHSTGVSLMDRKSPALYAYRVMACADLERFVGGGSKFLNFFVFFLKLMRDRGSKYHYKWTFIDPPAKRHFCSLNMHVQLYSGARCLKFGHSVCVSSECSDKTVRMRWLVGTIAACVSDFIPYKHSVLFV